MKLKLFLRYLILYLPFVLGIICYSYGNINLVSSLLLLFLGGYVSLKNTFDYRMVRRNVKKINDCRENSNNLTKDININDKQNRRCMQPRNIDNVLFLKRVRRYSRVRRKY